VFDGSFDNVGWGRDNKTKDMTKEIEVVERGGTDTLCFEYEVYGEESVQCHCVAKSVGEELCIFRVIALDINQMML